MNPSAHKQASQRAKAAAEILRNCTLCPRQCRIDRLAGQKGYCRLDANARSFREMLHFGEESELIPSHQVYFAGCNLACEFCTVAEWNAEPEAAEPMNTESLKQAILQRQQQGARTLNLLGGEPTISLHAIIELLATLDASTKVVLNSNMYYSSRVDELLTGLVDVYLADIKCGNANCAERLLDAADYVEVVKHNILAASNKADVIVRHLLLPGHHKCCLEPVLQWLAEELPHAKLSLRTDYIPPADAKAAPTRYPQPKEMIEAEELARKMHLNLVK